VVTDKNGKQVTDLTDQDFEILEDNRPQKIPNLSYITIKSADTTAQRQPPAAANERAQLIGAVTDREPLVSDPKMFGHAKLQPVFLRRFAKQTHDVFLWSHRHRVPVRMFLIPETKVVVMGAHADKVFRTGLFVEINDIVGIELVRLPGFEHVLKAEF
jgi:hypothetical protein